MALTLKKSVDCVGLGVHSGTPVKLTLHPAPAGTGRVFRRTDLEGCPEIAATLASVVDTQFNTSLANQAGVKVQTVEHLLAALSAHKICDVYMDVDGKEVPILDGSAAVFDGLIQSAGVVEQKNSSAYPVYFVDRPLSLETDYGAKITLEPAHQFSLEVTVDFRGRDGLANQTYASTDVYKDFSTQIAPARTFGFYEDAEKLWAAGLAKGASLDNTLVFKEGVVVNAIGMKGENECARHKALDIMGDFALLHAELKCHVVAYNPGHHLNYLMMQKLVKTQEFLLNNDKK